jgi:trimeric autotransporter adhesin
MKNIAILLVVVLGIYCGVARSVQAALPQGPDAHAAGTARVATPANAEGESVPRLVQFSGALKDTAARPIAGVASVTFAIYAEQDGGAALWSETQNVLADSGGHFSVLLGAASAAGVPAELFGTGQARWLGVTIARQPEMARVLLASVPYALKAGDAETLGGLPASAYVTNESLAAKTPTSTTILAPGGTMIASTAAEISTGASAGGAAAPAAISNATPTGGGTTDFIPLWTSATALGNSLLFQTGGNVGINTKTPTETLDVNGNSIFRGSFQLPPGHPATTATGYESHSFQFQASSYNSSTKTSTTQSFGFRAEPLNNNTANPSAVLDLFFIPNGGSNFVNTGVSWSSAGLMTFAPGQTFNGASETLTGALNLPTSSGSTAGVINLGGLVFLSNGGDVGSVFVGTGLPQQGSAHNSALGAGALSSVTGGEFNTALGAETLQMLQTGFENTAVGSLAQQLTNGGEFNTSIGANSLQGNVSGSFNTALGAQTGAANISGDNLTFVGAASTVLKDGLTNASAVGFEATVNASNSLVLGSINGVNQATSSVNVGIGTTAPAYALEVIDSDIGPGTSAIFGTSSFAGHNGVFGAATATSGGSNGGFFTTASPSGAGVVGTNTGGGLAASFQGNVQVTGTLTKGGGSFKIDDPIDPAGEYLSHSFVESPDMMNIYNGNVTTDADGFAVVTMPDWFEALNGDFRYQLTAVGQFAQAMVASKIKDGKFTIRTDKPNVEISWQVTGIRHDAWANAHRIPTEEVKPANEQGKYLHPELFGAGPEKQVGAVSDAKAAPAKSAAVPGAE